MTCNGIIFKKNIINDLIFVTRYFEVGQELVREME